MADENAKFTWLWWYSVRGGFWGRWLQIDAKNSETYKGGSNMADQNAKSWLIRMKFGTQGILGSLIRIRVWNSEIKHGGPKCKITWFGWNLVLGGLWVTDYEFELKIQKFIMADPIWRQKIQEMTWFGWNSVLGELIGQKWKMADPI